VKRRRAGAIYIRCENKEEEVFVENNKRAENKEEEVFVENNKRAENAVDEGER